MHFWGLKRSRPSIELIIWSLANKFPAVNVRLRLQEASYLLFLSTVYSKLTVILTDILEICITFAVGLSENSEIAD